MISFPDQSHLNCVRDALWSRSTGGASLMVGAGFSRNADKSRQDVPDIPIWDDLANSMHGALYPSENESVISHKPPGWSQSESVLRLAQEFEVAFGEQKLFELIKRQIRDDDFIPGDFHTRLLRLPWQDIFTTNWDTLLERTRSSVVQRAYGLVRTMGQIPLYSRPRIIKLHGCLSQHSRLIFTEEDYRTYQLRYSPFVNTVQQAMMETVFCLIGFSGDDPNFLHWSGWVRDNMGESAPRIYLAGWLNLSTHKRRMLEARNVTPIDLSCHPQASEWPDALRHKYSTDWLLTSLELGRPYDISDWPVISKKPEKNPQKHLEPVQRLSSTIPLSESTSEQDLEKQTNDTDSVKRIIKIWSHNRKLYPGWLVIPFSRVHQLSSNTEEWQSKIVASLPDLEAVDKLTAIAELVWRKSTLLEPLHTDIVDPIEKILNSIDCSKETIEGSSVSTVNWPEIRITWVMMAMSLLRNARHEINRSLFDEWLRKLSGFKTDYPEVNHMLQHEMSL